MKAWELEHLGGSLRMVDRPIPDPRPGCVVVRMEASSVMSYMKDYVAGRLPVYHAPDRPFVPGGNGVGVIEAVGVEVWHLRPGQRVMISPHFVARENVEAPGQILIGVTAAGAVAERMQGDWPDGTLASHVLLPAAVVTPVDPCADLDITALAVSMRFVVPYGGLLRGRLAAGDTVIVSGATGAYGAAAVLLAEAMGASKVVALGRNAGALERLAARARGRVVPFVVSGESMTDAAAIRQLAGGGANLAFDMVGDARDPNMTLAALRGLGNGGRLVLMGSMSIPLPIPYVEVMLNGWEILGQFMYPPDAYRRLLALAGSGQLDFGVIDAIPYPLRDLPAAIEHAASAASLECVVMKHEE